MKQSSEQFVIERYPGAHTCRTGMATGYFVYAPQCPGVNIGWGTTRLRAWQDAADSIRRRNEKIAEEIAGFVDAADAMHDRRFTRVALGS